MTELEMTDAELYEYIENLEKDTEDLEDSVINAFKLQPMLEVAKGEGAYLCEAVGSYGNYCINNASPDFDRIGDMKVVVVPTPYGLQWHTLENGKLSDPYEPLTRDVLQVAAKCLVYERTRKENDGLSKEEFLEAVVPKIIGRYTSLLDSASNAYKTLQQMKEYVELQTVEEQDAYLMNCASGCCWNPDPPSGEKDYTEWLNDPKYTSHVFDKYYLSRSSRSVELVMNNMQVDGWQCEHDVSTGNLYCRKKL